MLHVYVLVRRIRLQSMLPANLLDMLKYTCSGSRDAPSLGIVIAIARLFNISTDYLLRDTLPVEHQELTD